MASSALPDTLRSITAIKIEEVKKQRDQYEITKKQIVRDAKPLTDDLSRTRKLLEGSCRLAGLPVIEDHSSDHGDDPEPTSDLARSRRNQQLFLRQAGNDPSFADGLVEQIHDDLVEHLNLNSVQHEHAQFFSELVTEWLSTPKDPGSKPTHATDESFESLGRKEMHEQRAQWESIVFSKADTDGAAIEKYLKNLFKAHGTTKKHFKDLETSTKDFCRSLRSTPALFDTDQLEITIKGVLKTDLLSDEKSATLKSFKAHPAVLQEVADVLNMRFASLDTWTWATTNGAISVEQRRQLNGKYRVFMDEDVLDALLLHAIGMKWAVHFRACLTAFFASPAWNSSATRISLPDRERRRWFVGESPRGQRSVDATRKVQYSQDYFMSLLPIKESEGARGYDDSDDGMDTQRKSPIEVKQNLLHLLITEALLAKHLRPDVSHAVIRSDFEWFGPSLPHSTIFAVLKFFGVDELWLGFFHRFLEAPLRFTQDGLEGQYHLRRRGVPMSHALSDVFGEVILFVMDFAVNAATNSYLYRLHDDFWFWGTEELCQHGWKTMTEFASVMGIHFNREKTGSVVFGSTSASATVVPRLAPPATTLGLPDGEVRWGFLYLDAAKTRFVIDQKLVDDHIKELRRQLSHCTSIFSYVQAYNAYLARFFVNNFGKPSYAFGREHIDDMINTFARIQNALFPNGSVTDHLNSLASERFGVKDIPDGVWYWPIQMGGLELRNPMVALYCMRETLRQSPKRILLKRQQAEGDSYIKAKTTFEHEIKNYGRPLNWSISTGPGYGETFMSMDEYLRYSEAVSDNLYRAYVGLLEVPDEFRVHETQEISAWLGKLPGSNVRSAHIQQTFETMQPYWKWILAVYGAQIVEKYGGIQIVDAAQVPLGVVTMLKAGKVRWEG
jgi:hypothetical protein